MASRHHRHALRRLPMTQRAAVAALARDAAAAEREHQELLGAVISSLYRAGLNLQASLDLPADAAGQRVTAVLDDLDGIIRGIRDSVFTARVRAALPPERQKQIDQEERSRPTLSRP